MAARNRLNKVYSIYHSMEDRGVFEKNPANVQSVDNDGNSLYRGPVEYPKMLYHPRGETQTIFQGVMVVDVKSGQPILGPDGLPRFTGTQVGIKNRIVQNAEEEAELLAQGWHHTEAQARRQNPEVPGGAPPKSASEVQAERIRELEAKLAAQEAHQSAPKPVGGKS